MGTRTDKGTGMIIAGVLFMLFAAFSLFFTSNSIPTTFVALGVVFIAVGSQRRRQAAKSEHSKNTPF